MSGADPTNGLSGVGLSRRALLGGLVLAGVPGLAAGGALAATAVDPRITAVRSEVAAINARLGRLKKRSKDIEGVSLEGAQATYWSSGTTAATVQKISARVFGETFRDTFDIYYQGGWLIFAFDIHERYTSDLTSPVASSEQRRLYQRQGTVLRLQIGPSIVSLTSDRSKDVIRTMQSVSGDLLAHF
jgi:hypothetical protein